MAKSLIDERVLRQRVRMLLDWKRLLEGQTARAPKSRLRTNRHLSDDQVEALLNGAAPPLIAGSELTPLMARDTGPKVKRRRPGPPRSMFWKVIGPPPRCGPNERYRAKLYHDAILTLMEGDYWRAAPPRERNHLRGLELRWRKRANGTDVRFNLVGNRSGGLARGDAFRLKVARGFS
jgi:hypothetical protein